MAHIVDLNRDVQFFKINISSLHKIYDSLPMKDLFTLSLTCKRLYVSIQYYVTDLQIILDDEYGALHLAHLEKNHVLLDEVAPDVFLYPNPPFQRIKKLFLNFDGSECGKINLINLKYLEYLKIRGPNIILSSNRLPSVKEIDLEDVDTCERQVFIGMEKFIIEFDLEELGQIYNATESKTLERVFIKALDILIDKKYIEYVKFTISLKMETASFNEFNDSILKFEKFVDSVETFLKDYESYIDEGKIDIILKHSPVHFEEICDYDSDENLDEEEYQKTVFGLQRRFKDACNRLKITLPDKHYNFKIITEELKNIPVY